MAASTLSARWLATAPLVAISLLKAVGLAVDLRISSNCLRERLHGRRTIAGPWLCVMPRTELLCRPILACCVTWLAAVGVL